MTDSRVQGLVGFIHENLSEALTNLGPNPSQEQIHNTCVEVLQGCHLVPTVDQCWSDPDGTFHFTLKWNFSK